MHTIRRVFERASPANASAVATSKAILVAQFPYLTAAEVDALFDAAFAPLAADFQYQIIVAEDRRKRVLGVLVASYFPKAGFHFLDYIATDRARAGGGVGGALYERLREEVALTPSKGIFFDCLPDDRALAESELDHKQNVARLRFYERYGARPLEGTAYGTPRSDGSVFHLVFDGLGERESLTRAEWRVIVRRLLETKHGSKCSREYVQQIADSAGPKVGLRAPKYRREAPVAPPAHSVPADERIALIVNAGHLVHHVKERGYVESPVRIPSILKELAKVDIFVEMPAKRFPDAILSEVHDPAYLRFLEKICKSIGDNDTRYPDVFPVRNTARLPKELDLQIGYYCIDTFTPLNANAYRAARGAVDCALTAASEVAGGRSFAYALVRPPGHHAERRYFGGFCYLNNSAIAAHFLSRTGRVALLDIDYHHGNGQQDIFYGRSDVLTISIHGNPEFAYPNFTGFADECGEGEGAGFNLNLPLERNVEGPAYRKTLRKALTRIREFAPTYLVVALGLDTAKNDPTGTWLLSAQDFGENGKLIAELGLPTVVVQEGGYQNRVVGLNARSFLQGLWTAFHAAH